MPLFGFDVVDGKRVVLPSEAEQVRQIFGLYLQNGSLLATVKELNRRAWTTKTWDHQERRPSRRTALRKDEAAPAVHQRHLPRQDSL
jgi:hypothetical protein